MYYLIPPMYGRVRIRIVSPMSAIAQGIGYTVKDVPQECLWEYKSTSNVVSEAMQLD